MVYVYEDYVELQMKNYGEETGIRKYPSSYSIPLKKEITSSVYDIDQTDSTISGVAHNTTVEEFLDTFDEEIRDDLRVIDFDGTAITDTEAREVRSNMKVQYARNENVMAELTIRVNKAAESDMPYSVNAVTLLDAGGNPVHALRQAEQISQITVTANTEDAGEAKAFIGLYDAEGQMIRSAWTKINGSGDYDITLSLADLPEGATWRAMVYDSFATMTAMSYPMTSDDEHYVLETIAASAETEYVLGGDQRNGTLTVFKQESENWNDESAVVWKWQPTTELGFDDAFISSYKGSVSDIKLRYSDYYGGYVVVTCSGNSVCIVDYETGENLFSTAYKSNNLHAIELLPDGNIVTAGSSGNSLTLFAASQGDDDKNGNTYAQKYTFTDAHGLLWDSDLNVLWALGGKEVTAYQMAGTPAEPMLVQRTDLTTSLPTNGGHDLYPVYGEENKLWVTTESKLYQFDTDSRTFTPIDAVTAENIKSIGNQPYSGTLVRTIADEKNGYAVWCTDTVELLIPQADGSYQSVKKTVNDASYYKARVWYYKYQ